MPQDPPQDLWESANAYERLMGRWSRELGRAFVSWLGIPEDRHWLEVGCGTGALTSQILEIGGAQSVVATDASPQFQRLMEWTPPAELLPRVAGRYHSAHLDYTWTILLGEAGELVLRAPTMADIPVEPCLEGEFLAELEEFAGVPYHVWIRFHENESGEITHLTAWNPRLMHHRFDRRER